MVWAPSIPTVEPPEDDGPKSCGTRRNSKSTGTRTGGGSLLMYQLPLDPQKTNGNMKVLGLQNMGEITPKNEGHFE